MLSIGRSISSAAQMKSWSGCPRWRRACANISRHRRSPLPRRRPICRPTSRTKCNDGYAGRRVNFGNSICAPCSPTCNRRSVSSPEHMIAPPLLLSRRFAALFWCQFFAAFNDNFLKTALVFLILFRGEDADAPALITLASAIFIAPYFFLSGLAGELADRHDKARVAQWVKFVEIFVAALAILG